MSIELTGISVWQMYFMDQVEVCDQEKLSVSIASFEIQSRCI